MREHGLARELVGKYRGRLLPDSENLMSREQPGECEPWSGLIDELSTTKSKVASGASSDRELG